MTESTFNALVYAWLGLGVVVFPLLLKIPAPYGRHTRPGWGITVPNHLGWLIMELPALVVFVYFFMVGSVSQTAATWLFFALWVLHYSNRSFVFPFRLKTEQKRMPVIIVAMAFVFNIVNGFVCGHYFGSFASGYSLAWLTDPRFLIGAILFFSGVGLNWHSDHVLLGLRGEGQNHYSIPVGGMFRYISCPNFLGEIIEWGGFALMTWSIPTLAFFVWTLANLIPRALDHHRWYRRKFEDYPPSRRALIPFLI
jgi:hypothetical protein